MGQAGSGNAEVGRWRVVGYAPAPTNPLAALFNGIFDPAARSPVPSRTAIPDFLIPAPPQRPVAAPRQAAAPATPRPTRLVCVRLCDGYFFPAPNAAGHTRDDEPCAQACPGAPTRLYSMRTDAITDAVAVRTGAPYRRLPVSLQYTRRTERTCSCGAIDPQDAIGRDTTLRRGDRYMTSTGFVIYQGPGGAGARRPGDFTPLAQARGMPASERKLLVQMEKASRAPGAALVAGNPGPRQVATGPESSFASR